MRLLITGSRDWDDEETIQNAMVRRVLGWIETHPEVGSGPTDWVTVVHGGCPTGADNIADRFCNTVTYWRTEVHKAAWDQHTEDCPEWHETAKFCKAAGFRRNAEMVEAGADVCLAFIKDDSKGASHTAALAEQAGIETVRFTA